jgi:hypothetical protein
LCNSSYTIHPTNNSTRDILFRFRFKVTFEATQRMRDASLKVVLNTSTQMDYKYCVSRYLYRTNIEDEDV